MCILVEFQTGELGSIGHCLYHRNDLTLEYSVSAQPRQVRSSDLADILNVKLKVSRPQRLLIIADTLTLLFVKRDSEFLFVSLDAYTNNHLWKPVPRKEPPKSVECGSLFVGSIPPDIDDRYTLNVVPRYEFSSEGKWVRIVLSERDSTECYEIARDILVALKDGRIIDLYLLNLDVR